MRADVYIFDQVSMCGESAQLLIVLSELVCSAQIDDQSKVPPILLDPPIRPVYDLLTDTDILIL